jgi:aminomuconate-semialdehyde/2-hydroxymuconate-6-semialdehyde dehydrogenase
VITHPLVKGVSFTGGTATGRHVAQAAAGRFIKASLELGGKNAAVVFADTLTTPFDVAATAKAVARAAFLNSGQICLCGSRILVEDDRVEGQGGGSGGGGGYVSRYEQFVEALLVEVESLVIGDPLDPSTDVGPLSSHAHRNRVAAYVDTALRDEPGSAVVLCGGGRVGGDSSDVRGAYLEPTLIGGVSPTARIATEEIFGPIATVHPFRSNDGSGGAGGSTVDGMLAAEAAALSMANKPTPYGLCATVWTKDLERAHRVGRGLQVGMVWVNTWLHRDLRTPFGGVKESGLGREGGHYSLDFFSETKNICIALDGSRFVPPMPSKMS